MRSQNPYPSPQPQDDNGANPLRSYEARLNRAAVSQPNPRVWTRRQAAKPIKSANWFRRHRKLSITLTILLLLIAGGTWFALSAGRGKFNLAALLGSSVRTVLLGDRNTIARSGDRTNIIVYGMTQDGHRTDSIMLVSYYWNEKKLVMINIPRDLYAYDGYENAKMGEIYAYAQAREPKNPTYPDTFVENFVSKEYSVPIQYWVQVNMQGEVDFVNAIGGIDINVPDSFTDCEYPTWDYSGYVRPCPHFSAGPQHMDGATALVYSRSRHALQNGEGSDFARSKRQQLVITAIVTKMKSMGVVGNLVQVSHYLNILGNNMTTNMSTDELVSLAATLRPLHPTTDFIHGSWETGDGFLCDSTSSYGAYITLYGVTGDCTVGAGGYHDDIYRQMAIYYMNHLLTSAQQSPAAFVTQSQQALGYSSSTSDSTSTSTSTGSPQ